MPRRRFTERYNLPPVVAPGYSYTNARGGRVDVAPRRAGESLPTDSTNPYLQQNSQRVPQADPLRDAAREAQIARAQSSDAKAQYQLQKEIETDRQKAAFYNGLQELESNLNAQGHKIGSAGHAEAFAAYAHEFPLARSAKDVQQTLKLHSQIADDQAALKQRMLEMSPPPEKIAQRYAKVQGDISTFSATPGKEADLSGALVESDQIEKAYPQLKVPTLPQQTVYPDEGTPTPTPSVQIASGYGQPATTPASTVAPVQPSPTPATTAPPLADIFADQPQTP